MAQFAAKLTKYNVSIGDYEMAIKDTNVPW